MIARIERGGGFAGCLGYVFRERSEDKNKYLPTTAGHGEGVISCPTAPVSIIVIRICYHGSYIGTILDRGNYLTAAGYFSDKAAAWNLTEQAANKGWQKVEASGSDDFLRHTYDFLLGRGIEIITKDSHQAKILDEVKKDRALAGKDKWKKMSPPPQSPKPLAPQIVGGNMSGQTAKELSQEFGAGRRQRPNVKKPVWHSILSLKPGEHLNQEQWKELANKYMQKMGFNQDHEFVAVQHFDKEYEHIHIVANRIGLDGQLFQGRWEAKKAHKITNELAVAFGLETVEIKEPMHKRISRNEINKSVRTGKAPERMNLQLYLDEALKGKPTTQEFIRRLKYAGVIACPNIASTGRMNGFSFTIKGSIINYSGSSLGKAYTWKRIKEAINYEQDRDVEYLVNARDSARAAGDQNTKGVGRTNQKEWGNSTPDHPTNQPVRAVTQHNNYQFDTQNRAKNKENIRARRQNKRDDFPSQKPRRLPNPGQNLASVSGKRSGRRRDRRGSATSAPVKWPFDFGSFSFLHEWWAAYQAASPKNKRIIKKQVEQIQRIISVKSNIFPIFWDADGEYYNKAIAEILTRTPETAANLSASDLDDLIAKIMKRRERPAKQIKAVLNQSPMVGGSVVPGVPRSGENEKIGEIAEKIAPGRSPKNIMGQPTVLG